MVFYGQKLCSVFPEIMILFGKLLLSEKHGSTVFQKILLFDTSFWFILGNNLLVFSLKSCSKISLCLQSDQFSADLILLKRLFGLGPIIMAFLNVFSIMGLLLLLKMLFLRGVFKLDIK